MPVMRGMAEWVSRVRIVREGRNFAHDSARYRERLSELAAILDGIPWLLAGGLAIPMTLGRFYRDHSDQGNSCPSSK